jgi:DNA-binding CsgD family transcriptional regulator
VLGRASEIEQLTKAIRRADLVGAVLTGEAGVGKSTLLASAVSKAQNEGFVVVQLFGSRATSTLPLHAFSSFLAQGADDQSIERFLAVRRALTDHSGGRPVLVAVDDAHLLDDSSAVLVSQLARELAIFLLCSVRTGEPTPEPISSLWVQGSATLIHVGPLTREFVGEPASAALGGPISTELESELWKRTGGNPLHARELSLGSLASGSIREINGVWNMVGPLATSTALVDLVRQRLSSLNEDEQHALCCVALSEPAGIGLLEAVTSGDSLIKLEETGLVRVFQDRRRTMVRLTHPLYGEVVRSQTSQLRARKIRRTLAETVLGFNARRRDDTLAVASWQLDAGDVHPVGFANAAFDAIHRHDTDLAERLASAAHDHEPSSLSGRALAMTRHLLGRHTEALAVLAAPLAQAEPQSAEWARIGFLDGLIRARGVGDYPGALVVLDLVANSQTSIKTRDRAEAMIALIQLLQGDAGESCRRAEQLVKAGTAEAEAFTAYVGAVAAGGHPAQALGIVDEFLARNPETNPQSLFPDFHWVALLDAGALDTTSYEVAAAWENATDLSDQHRQARSALAYGHVLLDRGQSASARQWFETSAGFFRLIGERFGERWALSGRLLASAYLGDTADAEVTVSLLDAIPSHPAAFFEVYGKRGMAWLRAARGEPTQAREDLLVLAASLRASGCVSHALRALLDVARLGDPRTAAKVVAEFEDQLDGLALPTFVTFVKALAESSTPALISSADQLAQLGYSALAAEAASAARDSLARDGRVRDAAGWARRASDLLSTIEGGVTPLFIVVEAVVPLTRREREIAAFVAAGRTSREVADSCFLSVRTVETHLARVYDKLGVRTRSELADALSPLTPTYVTPPSNVMPPSNFSQASTAR